HRGAAPDAEVEHHARPAVQQAVHCREVGGGQIVDVNVVADAGAVAGVVVTAVDLEAPAQPGGDFQHHRGQVGRIALGRCHATGDVVAGGVEVAKADVVEPGQAREPGEVLLDGKLGVS